MFLVIANISKRANIRSLLLTAAAFGCRGVFVVKQRKFDTDPSGTDVPSAIKEQIRVGAMPIRRFDKWEEFMSYLKDQNIRLIGVEIHKDAQPIEHYFNDDRAGGTETAFLMGNEGLGLNKKQMMSCDAFVRIPQYGGGTASLNVYVASSIILYRYHQWERRRQKKQNKEPIEHIRRPAS